MSEVLNGSSSDKVPIICSRERLGLRADRWRCRTNLPVSSVAQGGQSDADAAYALRPTT